MKEIVSTNVDILLICETKLDSSFPRAQFHIHGFREPYRFDRNGKGGGILLYIRDDIPSKLIESKMTIEGLFVEINLRKKKCLLCCFYNPKNSLISLTTYRKLVITLIYCHHSLMGDFNSEPNEQAISDFCEIYNTKNFIKEKTFFKNPENPTCVDLILTNRPRSFQDSTVVETGLSDFHKMCVTVMKMYHCQQRPSVITYRKFKDFSNIEFIKDPEEHLTKFEHFDSVPSNLFKENVNTILEKHAPTTKKYVRANQAPFISKTLSKEIMKRSRLRKTFLNTKSDIDRKVYNKQRNYVVSLLRKEKKDFYGNLDISKMTDNRVFWKIVKPKISDKVKIRSKITLVEDDKILSQEAEIAKTFNEYFINIPILNMPNNQSFSTQARSLEENTISGINERYKDHPNITLIKSKNSCLANTFSFTPISIEEVKRAIESLDPKKAAEEKDIHTNILKQISDFFEFHVQKDINASISTSKFPDDLKEAGVTPLYKKKSKLSKENYRPISILPNISKVYERCLYDQMSKYFETRFSKFQCGFRKRYSAQHCLLAMIKKWKTVGDNGGVFAALLTDLSKAFDYIPHDLITAKLAAYGFDTNALRLIHNYLSNRKQRVENNSVYSIWKDISYGVPQGSILGPLLFNIHLCDLFYLQKTLISLVMQMVTLSTQLRKTERQSLIL